MQLRQRPPPSQGCPPHPRRPPRRPGRRCPRGDLPRGRRERRRGDVAAGLHRAAGGGDVAGGAEKRIRRAGEAVRNGRDSGVLGGVGGLVFGGMVGVWGWLLG